MLPGLPAGARGADHCPAELKEAFFIIFLAPPPPPLGDPEEGPGCHFPKEINDLWPMSARIRGQFILNFYFDLKYSLLKISVLSWTP